MARSAENRPEQFLRGSSLSASEHPCPQLASSWGSYRSDFAGTCQIRPQSAAVGFCLSKALSERLWRFGINRTERPATCLPGWPANLSFACTDADRAHEPVRLRFQVCSFPAQGGDGTFA